MTNVGKTDCMVTDAYENELLTFSLSEQINTDTRQNAHITPFRKKYSNWRIMLLGSKFFQTLATFYRRYVFTSVPEQLSTMSAISHTQSIQMLGFDLALLNKSQCGETICNTTSVMQRKTSVLISPFKELFLLL